MQSLLKVKSFGIVKISLGLVALILSFGDLFANEPSANEAASIILKRTASLQELIKDNQTESDWYKVNKVNYFFNQKITYQEDKPVVIKKVKELVDAGDYPGNLFGE